MCIDMGGGRGGDVEIPGPPPPAPPVMPTEKLQPVLPPQGIDRGPQDLARRKEKPIVKSKKVKKDKLAQGTTQLQINPTPITGGTNVGGTQATAGKTNTGV